MTQPTPYIPAFGFTDWSSAPPSDPHPGTAIDGEFNALALTLGQTLANLALVSGQIVRFLRSETGSQWQQV